MSIRLGEIMATKSGSVDPSKFPDEVFDLYSIPAFDRGEPEIVPGKQIGSAKQVVEPGDVLLSKIVPHIRRTWVVGANRGRRIIASGEWIVFRDDRLHPKYMRHVLVGDPFHAQFMSTVSGVGGSLLRARPAHVANITVPLPPLPEQRRIAEVLDRAEALRAKRHAALAQLDTLTQSIFLDMFGDPATNPKGWPKQTLDELSRGGMNNGLFRKNPDYLSERSNGRIGLPVVWVEELFRGDWIDTSESRRVIPSSSEIAKYGLKTGDILFCRSSLKLDGIAFSNVYLGPERAAMFECHVIRFSPNLSIVSPVFLNCLLRTPQIRAIAKSKSNTATMTTIDQGGLCSLELPLPPIQLQQTFERRAEGVWRQKAVHRQSLANLDVLFASLQDRAFRGEL